ncbi:MAG: NAD-glutamate dehydrogenase [Solirubrobacterales bacterium]|nr:NAD-glutamate dehydrogenase [Solirubrobacterales bacterium]
MTVTEEVVALARERVNGDRDDALAAFARAYLRRPVGARDDERTDPEAVLAEVRGAFALADRRDGAPIAVRAFTPTKAEHGYEAAGSVLETNTDDLPFLVDSVSHELRARGHHVARVVHPIVGVVRDRGGAIERVCHPREGERESVMHFELGAVIAPEELAALEDAVRAILATVAAVVRDFADMEGALQRMASLARGALGGEEAEEVVAFLDWVRDGHFVFLGFREEERDGEGAMRPVPGSGRGLLAEPRAGEVPPPLRIPGHDPPPAGPREADVLAVSKTSALSPVHRREPMDAIVVRRVDDDGKVIGEARLLGLFTHRAYGEPASSTPLLRRRLRRIVEAEDLIDGSHDWKAAVALFDSFPKDELFAAPLDDLRATLISLLMLQGDDVRLLGRRSGDRRSASLVAALPRPRYSPAVREQLRELVATAFETGRVDDHEVLGEGDRVQVHFAVHSAGGLPDVDVDELERRLVVLARTWFDRTGEVLARVHGDERGRMLAARWLRRLPESYRAAVDPEVAAEDVRCFEALATGADPFLVGLQPERGPDGAPRTRVALYKRGPKVELSQATPMLEHLGLRVIEELPVRLRGEDETWLQAFAVLNATDQALELEDAGDRIADALAAVWRGDAESDSLNRLVVTAGLTWRQVQVLRAYRRYRQRIGSRYTESFQNDVIAANAEITAKLMRLFELRFDPSLDRDDAAEQALREEVLADLDDVALLDHDRILRNQLGLIDATIRTNVFRSDRDAMSFKLRSGDVPAMPQPAPLFEIYVYAADMEGIHLRGGRIARGGIRWSDRMDYRTEVYGLMRAQMTKNAVIVPAGAKGGFFLKQAPDDPREVKAEVRRQYVRYIEALLDVTDNLVDGEVEPPTDVVVHDEVDTYLVVAADKGTAPLSDTANEVAVRRGFWLGDAFASGGSAGYDHKALGITARGAWESVKRHFRELGVDPEADVITVVGIGDMSGDVFGNGMLLSRTLKLVAAYDHRHVFIDPDPDPERSWEERKRLFDLAGSSWDDYDRELLSEGGGIWPRTAKRIRLPERAREVLGIEDEELAPTDVIRAILRARVDLLWNGGIGTIVKASTESDADARDRSSDAIRVDASDLRARVVGEGGNLGFTQRARIEAARNGVRVNADFIDNSAGVDSSDHEVNLKILLDLAVRRGDLDREGRDRLLLEVTEDVVGHVLYDSYLQAQILSQELRGSPARMFAYEDLMEDLEEDGMLHRAAESLPAPDEMAERRRSGEGLTAPELAVLVAYAKRSLTDALLDSELPDDPAVERDVRTYFPRAVVERFGELIAEHPLRRELVATLVANDVVNALGPTFVSGLTQELGASAADVVRAYRIAREVTGATARWLEVEGLDGIVDQTTAWDLLDGIDELVADVARWYLLHAAGADIASTIDAGHEAFVRLAEVIPGMRAEEWQQHCADLAQRLSEAGVPDEVAHRHAHQPALGHAPDAIAVAWVTGRDVEKVARAFFALGHGLHLEELEREVDGLPASTRTQRWAQNALRDDVLEARKVLVERALEAHADADPEEAVAAFLEDVAQQRRRFHGLLRAMAVEGDTDLAALTLAVRHLRGLANVS